MDDSSLGSGSEESYTVPQSSVTDLDSFTYNSSLDLATSGLHKIGAGSLNNGTDVMSFSKYYPVDNFGTVVGENPDCLLLSGTVVGENPDHVCWV